MKPLRRLSFRQLMLPLERETTIQLGEKVREEMIGALADLLLEALNEPPNEPREGGALHESED